MSTTKPNLHDIHADHLIDAGHVLRLMAESYRLPFSDYAGQERVGRQISATQDRMHARIAKHLMGGGKAGLPSTTRVDGRIEGLGRVADRAVNSIPGLVDLADHLTVYKRGRKVVAFVIEPYLSGRPAPEGENDLAIWRSYPVLSTHYPGQTQFCVAYPKHAYVPLDDALIYPLMATEHPKPKRNPTTTAQERR